MKSMEMIRHDINDACQMLIGAECDCKHSKIKQADLSIERAMEILISCRASLIVKDAVKTTIDSLGESYEVQD